MPINDDEYVECTFLAQFIVRQVRNEEVEISGEFRHPLGEFVTNLIQMSFSSVPLTIAFKVAPTHDPK